MEGTLTKEVLMDTGSLTVETGLEKDKTTIPVVGMGVTEILWSDRLPFTIVQVKSDITIVVQRDKCRRTDTRGHYTEDQEYEFDRDPDGELVTLRLSKHGVWKNGSRRFYVGKRDAYVDPSF